MKEEMNIVEEIAADVSQEKAVKAPKKSTTEKKEKAVAEVTETVEKTAKKVAKAVEAAVEEVVEEIIAPTTVEVSEPIVVAEEKAEPVVVEEKAVVEQAVEEPAVVETKDATQGGNNNRQNRFGGNNRQEGRRDNNRRRPNDRDREKEFEERVVVINRVTKVVKGGRRFRFAALVVVGDMKGQVGMGTGKANEVPDAIKKAVENAKKNLFRVPIVATTIPHAVLGRSGAGQVFLKPASEGTGVIAGGPVRSVLELAGIKDVLSKCIGSRTPINVVRATVTGLKSLKTLDNVASIRDMKPEEVRK